MKTTVNEFFQIETDKETSGLTKWLDRIILAFLFLFAFAAPVSIAVTQIAFFSGIFFWILRLIVKPRFQFHSCYKPLELLFLIFFFLTALSSFFSYEPRTSIGKLGSASLFLIIYFVSQNIRSKKVFHVLVATLIAGAMLTVGQTFFYMAFGKGVKVRAISENTILYNAKCRSVAQAKEDPYVFEGVRAGNTILEANKKKVNNLSQLLTEIEGSAGATTIRVYRGEFFYDCEIPPNTLSVQSGRDEDKLGISDWSHGRDQRAAGFFGHFTTYGEALQLILSLAFGLFIALNKKNSRTGWILLICIAGLSASLLLTVTRGSQLGFFISAFVIVVASQNRKLLLVTAACALPLVVAGLFLLQQKRQVGFFDRNDASVSWRQTVWREGFRVATDSPRHLLVGVGMDSLKKHWREWGLFDNGKLPVGHLHSTPLQISFERGLPVLIIWFLILATCVRMLWRVARCSSIDDWVVKGVALGALGGIAGFFVSGFFHYNLGDSEVAMIFYLIIGLSLYVNKRFEEENKIIGA